MISVLYVNILIGELIGWLPCMLSWFLGSMSKHIFDLSRSIWFKKKESWKKWNMRSERFCNIHNKVRLGTSLWEHRAGVWNLKENTEVHKAHTSPPKPQHTFLSQWKLSHNVSWHPSVARRGWVGCRHAEWIKGNTLQAIRLPLAR